MTFDTPNGTKGARQPTAGRIMRWLNQWASKRIRKSGKIMGGMNALVLTTIGRKSGDRRAPGQGPDRACRTHGGRGRRSASRRRP
jgi:hypothetical protein